jgi:hypothetical protein
VGCEPASVDYEMELSEPVARAVDEAVRVVLDLVAEAGHGYQDTATSHDHRDAETGYDHGGAATTGTTGPGIPETTGEGVSHVPWHSR